MNHHTTAYRDDVSKTNVGEGYVNYQPDAGYDDEFDAWQNTQNPARNENTMIYGQGATSQHNSYQQQGY